MDKLEPKNNQNLWNFLYTAFFIFLFASGVMIIYKVNGFLPTAIDLFDFILIILASFRLTRLFIYDRVMKFFRDWFLDSREVITPEGEVLILREKPTDGPKRTAAEILDCPWCTGMWFALVVTFFYFLTPLAWLPILILAIASVASFVQILSNMVGWRAEYFKNQTNKE